MKKFQIAITSLALATCLVVSAFGQAAGLAGDSSAQTQVQAGAKAQARRHNLANVLNQLKLTADQKSQIKDLMSKNQETLKGLRKQVKAGTVSKDDAKKQIQASRKENRIKLMAVLTAEQKKQFSRLMKEARQKAKGAPNVGKGG